MSDLKLFNYDVKAVIDDLKARSLGDTTKIVLKGQSMGSGVIISSSQKLINACATIGIAPVTSPDWVYASSPKNLSLIISTKDSVINATSITQIFITTSIFTTLAIVFSPAIQLF